MRKLCVMCTLLALLVACQPPSQKTSSQSMAAPPVQPIDRDLDAIQEEGVLRAIMVYSGTSYFLYRGEAMGFEYEMIHRLADQLGVRLQIIIAKNIDDMFDRLNRGEADIIAHGMTITQDRKKEVAFTKYLYLTKQVLIQRKPANWRNMKLHQIDRMLVKDPIGLIDDTVSVRLNSSYFERLVNLQHEIGGNIIIDTLDGALPTDKIIEKVVHQEIKYTVADKNLASINASYYPILDINTPISFSQRISWAVRKNSTQLKGKIDEWLKTFKREVDYAVTYNKYFKNKRSFRKRVKSDLYSQKTGKISPYDELIKSHAASLGWDWRLLTAIIYQESQFDPQSKSWVEASGLMQLMPLTAKELGVEDVFDPDQNIQGGVKYLRQLWKRWEAIPDSTQRIKFTLASYNCGLGHVQDAQRLCKKDQKDPLRWDDNVEKEVLNLTYPEYYNDEVVKYGYVRGQEPVVYVRQIFDHFEHYRTLLSSPAGEPALEQ